MAGDPSGARPDGLLSIVPRDGPPAGRYRPIEDYALIGNAQSGALVATDGSIDWLCLPHFDSPAVLCRILDADRGGFLAVRPREPVVAMGRRYRPASAVLEATYRTAGGSLRLTDAMPTAEGDPTPALDGVWGGRGRHRVVRLLEALTADHPLEVELAARLGFDFAATPAQVELLPGRGALASDGGGRWLALRWRGELRQEEGGELRGALRLEPGRPAVCVLGWAESEFEARALLAAGDAAGQEQIEETDAAWRRWAAGCAVGGPYRDALLRSALTLKMMTFEPTGALVAAPTTSLPETIGGERNWDYRYCWLRDATFTLYALLLVGDATAARAFWGWIERTCGEAAPADLQIMYGLHGERELPERELAHLEGYRGSRPVRVGNGAADQRQLDVYGELLDALWFYHRHAGSAGQPPAVGETVWRLMREVADYICDIWRQPDQGLWETRSGPQHYVYSKVMCWVGLDRAVRLVETTACEGNIARWAAERDAVRADVLERGFNSAVGAFTMHYATEDLDAANLRLPLVGFIPADDPRMRATIERTQAELGGPNGLVHRYKVRGTGTDGLHGEEGAFSMCTFWLVDCLTALGRIEEAQALFERMLGYASDLGLFAEEVDGATGAALGNYPQAFTHLALIDACVDLTEALLRHRAVGGTTDERAGQVAEGVARESPIGT